MKHGFTLAELLIVVAIIIILSLLALLNIKNQINKSYDAKRKADLFKIHRAFDEYNNDKGCFPPLTILNNCGSADLAPYMREVPCDPQNKQPYLYKAIDESNICNGFRVLTGLQNPSDADIPRVGCTFATGCGYGANFNWGVSEGGPVGTNVPVPTATTTPAGGAFACTPGSGACNHYLDPAGSGCPVTFPDNTCGNACGNPSNWCAI